MLKVALVAPAGIVRVEGTVAIEGLLLASDTEMPPLGATPLSFTVPVELLHKIYDLARLRPTSANGSPGRFVFLTRQKQRNV